MALLAHYGRADLEADRPVADDTLWRIYSMTKPITSVAALMLYERGLLELTDPVSRFIPEFADAAGLPGRLGAGPGHRAGDRTDPGLAPAHPHRRADLRLPPHQPGGRDVPGQGLRVRRARAGWTWPGPAPRWAGLPLLFHPGTEWNYCVATDVLGRVVEVASGQPLDAFLAEHVLGPLDMTDTGFSVAAADLDRLAALYLPNPRGGLAAQRRDGRRGHPAGRPSCPAAAGWCPPPPTTTASPSCWPAAASWTGCGCCPRARSPT